MIRTLLSLLLGLGAFAVGVTTVFLAAKNRARAAELDARLRWCETFDRENELLRAEILRREWTLLEVAPVPDAVPEPEW